MKFKFSLAYSYLRDIFQFPRMYYTKENNEDSLSLFHLVFENDTEYLNDVMNIKSLLEPYKEDIERFYANDELGNYDLNSLLEMAFPIDDSSTLEDYYQMILKQEESVIKEKIIFALLLNDEDYQVLKTEKVTEKAHEILNNQNDMIAYLKDIHIEEDYRWQLLMNINKPIQAIEKHRIVIKKIQPIFDDYHQQKVNEIEEVKAMLEDIFSDGVEAFLSLTNHMIPKEYFKQDINIFFISISNPYQIIIRDSKDQPCFIWGLRMAQGFKYLQTLRENEIEKRVQIFKILSDKTRYNVLRLIALGETSTKKIANILQVSSATISYHINAFVTFDIIVLSSEKDKKYDVNQNFLDSFWESFLNDLKI